MGDTSLLAFALLGAVLGLDVVSFPQAMISRPLVAATLGGALAGNAVAGVLVGATLEFFALESLPFGASRYPEWGSAAVVGGALFAQQPEFRAGAMCLSVLAAGATALVGGESMVLLRRLNAQLARAQIEALARGSSRAVTMLQLSGLLFDFLRGFALTVVALGLASLVMPRALATWGTDPRWSRALVVTLAAMVAGGAVWKLVHALPRARALFLGGLALGLALLALR